MLTQSIRALFAGFVTKSATPLSSAAALEIFAPISASGVAITPETAMKCAAIGQGVKLISETVATLDCKLYQENDIGREPVVDHPVARVLRRPNGWTGKTEFTRQIAADMLLHGNGMALVSRVRGEVREMHRLDPRACTINVDPMSGEPSYSVSMSEGGTREFGFRDILHLKGISVDGVRGLGLVELGREAISLAILLERHGATMFSNGAKPGGVLEVVGKLTQDQLNRLRSSFANIYSGSANSGRTIILESGAKFVPLQLTSTDSQYLELRRFAVEECARLLNLPPVLLGDLSHATFSNAESLAQQYLDRTIAPLLEILEDGMERALLTDEERDAGLSIEFDVTNFVRADTEKRFAALKTGVEAGVLTINDARAKEGLAPVEGGDTPMRSVQNIPIGQTAPAPDISGGGAA